MGSCMMADGGDGPNRKRGRQPLEKARRNLTDALTEYNNLVAECGELRFKLKNLVENNKRLKQRIAQLEAINASMEAINNSSKADKTARIAELEANNNSLKARIAELEAFCLHITATNNRLKAAELKANDAKSTARIA